MANDRNNRDNRYNPDRNRPKMKIVYVITERDGKSFWNRVGVAFVNSDDSLNVKLESLPISGELHIRDYVPQDDPPPQQRRAAREEPQQRRTKREEPPQRRSKREEPQDDQDDDLPF